MVWFQCESCGDNLKKPKLQSHFQQCAAHRLSCIDCGVVFDRQSVQGHTSCVTEEVRYGPRDAFRQALANPSDGSKEAHVNSEENLELTIGLSTRPPWECSLCRVKCTSQETLQGHAQGKKHRAKARAAAKAQMEKEGVTKGVDGQAEKNDENAKMEEGGEKGTPKEDEAAPEGTANNVGPEAVKSSEKKRKDREGGVEDVKAGETPAVVETKKGKKQKKEAADAGPQAETGIAGVVEQGVDEKIKKGKKGKKAKVETGSDVGDLATDLANGAGRATADDEGTGAAQVGAEGVGGQPGKKGKKRKNGDIAEETGHEKQQEAPAEKPNPGPETKRKKGKAGKVLDGKQYWAELAETGRRKKQEETLAGGREGDGTVANGDPAQSASEEAPRKKKRKGALEKDADADEGKGSGAEANDGGRLKTGAKTAEKGLAVDSAEVVKPSKLRKMMQTILQEAPKPSLSIKKLVQSVLTQPGIGDVVAKDALRQQILLESATCTKFRIEGGKVSLTPES